MASPDQADTSPIRPFDAERARLRAAGLTEDEISKIFVARELGAQPQQAGAGAPAGAPGQGAMSGVLNNLNAVLAYARGVIPAIANQIVTLRDSSASASARITAGLSLTVKVALISVLGYAVWQEWGQHILSSPTIAQYQAIKSKMDACLAATETAGKTMSGASSQHARDAVQAQIDAICQEAWNLPPAVFHDIDPQGGLLQQVAHPHDAPPAAAQTTAQDHRQHMAFFRQELKKAGVPDAEIQIRAEKACLNVYPDTPEICTDQIATTSPAAEAPDPDPPSWARFWRITRANMSWTFLWHALLISLVIGCGIVAYAYISIYTKRLWSRFRAPRAAK